MRRAIITAAGTLGLWAAMSTQVLAQAGNARIDIDGIGAISAPLQVVLLLTLLSFIPAILMTMTAFTRIVIVFHFLRQALGTQEAPSNQILIGLSLFLTVFVMAPVGEQVNQAAVQPALRNEITVTQALERGAPPLRAFMLKQTRETDLALAGFIVGRALEEVVHAAVVERPDVLVHPRFADELTHLVVAFLRRP